MKKNWTYSDQVPKNHLFSVDGWFKRRCIRIPNDDKFKPFMEKFKHSKTITYEFTIGENEIVYMYKLSLLDNKYDEFNKRK